MTAIPDSQGTIRRPNMAHTEQSRPHSGIVFKVEILTTFSVDFSSLESGAALLGRGGKRERETETERETAQKMESVSERMSAATGRGEAGIARREARFAVLLPSQTAAAVCAAHLMQLTKQ